MSCPTVWGWWFRFTSSPVTGQEVKCRVSLNMVKLVLEAVLAYGNCGGAPYCINLGLRPGSNSHGGLNLTFERDP